MVYTSRQPFGSGRLLWRYHVVWLVFGFYDDFVGIGFFTVFRISIYVVFVTMLKFSELKDFCYRMLHFCYKMLQIINY